MPLDAEGEQDPSRRAGASLVSLAITLVTLLPILRFLGGPGVREDWLPLVKPFGYVLFGMSFFSLAKTGYLVPRALREAVAVEKVGIETLEELDRRAERRMNLVYFLGVGAGLFFGGMNVYAQIPANNSILVASFMWLATISIFLVAASDTRAQLVLRLSLYFERPKTSKRLASLWLVLGPAAIVLTAWLVGQVVPSP